jgi:hypothetical protein
VKRLSRLFCLLELAMTVGLLGSMGQLSAAFNPVPILSRELGPGNYTWDRPGATATVSSGERPYYYRRSYQFPVPGVYDFHLESEFNGGIYMYQNSFQPQAPYSNLWVNGITGGHSVPFSVTVNEPTVLVIVISAIETGEVGDFRLWNTDAPQGRSGSCFGCPPQYHQPIGFPDNEFRFVSGPRSQLIFSGRDAELEVHGWGQFPHSWQWYFGESGDTSQPVPGDSQGSVVRIPQLEAETKVWVRATNGDGSTKNSAAATLTPSNNPDAQFSGSLAPGMPDWRVQKRIEDGQTNRSYYFAVPIEIQENGHYTIHVDVDEDAFTPFISPYANTFNAAFPKSNFWTNGSSNEMTTFFTQGRYTVVVSSAGGSLVRGSFTGTIKGPEPVVLLPPPSLGFVSVAEDVTVTAGSTVTLDTAFQGPTPITVQWYEGVSGDLSRPISGANSARYTTPSLNGTTSYWVRLENADNIIQSRTISVFVISGSVSYTESFDSNSPQWIRPVGPGVNGDPLDRHHYDVFPFTVGLTGTYSFRATSNDFRPTVNVYAVSFDPTRPLSNFYNHHGLNSGASLVLIEA